METTTGLYGQAAHYGGNFTKIGPKCGGGTIIKCLQTYILCSVMLSLKIHFLLLESEYWHLQKEKKEGGHYLGGEGQI